MTYDMARPRYTLPLAGKEHELIGSFELIEAVEDAMKDSILNVMVKAIDMPVSDTAKLLAAILTACGEKASVTEIGGLLWNMGAATDEFAILRLHLHAFLRICIARPADRE